MTTNRDRILKAIRHRNGASDGELRVDSGVMPHQQVNQICRTLEQEGVVTRRRRPDGIIGNYWCGIPQDPLSSQAPHDHRAAGIQTPWDVRLPNRDSTLVVIPCSSTKSSGADKFPAGRSVLDVLQHDRAAELIVARARLAPLARLDESSLVPAWRRYTGHLALAAGRVLGELADGGRLTIISGGYGVLLGSEPIGWYNHRFRESDWPSGLLSSCLVDTAGAVGAADIVAFCSSTTAYAAILRRTRWRAAGLRAVLVTPLLHGQGGAMRLAPRTAGFAIHAFARGMLSDSWRSADDIGVSVEVLQ